jgi:DNA-binding GntR family transcriptional regulator
MPTLKPRLALTLPPETRAAVRDLADASGKAESTVVSELLAEMVPTLHDLAKLLRAAKSGKKAAAKAALRDLMGNAMAEVLTEIQPDLLTKGKGRK